MTRQRTRPALSALLSTVLTASSFASCLAQTTPQENPSSPQQPMREKPAPPPPTNPVADAVKQKDQEGLLKPPPKLEPLPDYTGRANPNDQREPRLETDHLPLFGYNVFEPARLAIRMRNAALAGVQLDRNGRPIMRDENGNRKPMEEPKPFTREELDAVASLTNAQKLDLLARQRDDRLTDVEKKKFRALLEPATGPKEEPEVDPAELLTPQEKLDLLLRQRDGKLTADEMRKYRRFLTAKKPEQPKTPTPSDFLTDQEKVSLLLKLRDGTLTDEERTKYADFLFPKRTEEDMDRARGSQNDREDQQDDYRLRGQGNLARQSNTQTRRRQGTREQDGMVEPFDRSIDNRFDVRGPGRDEYYDDRLTPYRSALTTQTVDAYHSVADPLSLIYQNVAASIPANYQIAPGDRITLRLSSPTMESRVYPLAVDNHGNVFIPGVPAPVRLAGQTVHDAESMLNRRLSRYYRAVETSVDMEQLRTISVTVSGEAFQAGTYHVPSVASAIDLLLAAGGPTDDGSLRTIEVLRNGTSVGSIDLYRLLINGDRSSDVMLRDGDVIYIPGHHARAAVRGEIGHPAVYELLNSESVRDALRYAGGVKPSGISQRVQVTTVRPGKERVLKDVDITAAGSTAVPVYDGDTIEVLSVRTTVANMVTVEGAVDAPSEYALTDGMTVRDLILKARGLLPDAYPAQANLYRVNPDNTTTLLQVNLEKALAKDPAADIPLHRWDRLKVYSQQEFVWTGRQKVTVRGAVKAEGVYAYSKNMRVKDLLLEAQGTLPDAYTDEAYVLHSRPDGTFAYDFVNLTSLLRGDDTQNRTLEENDSLFVFRTAEAHFVSDHRITIKGEVNAPADYPYGEGMLLSQALRMAGGLKPRAGSRIEVAHARTSESEPSITATYSVGTSSVSPDPQLKDGDIITVQGRGDFRDKPYVVNVEGAVNQPGPILLDGPTVRLSEVIKQAGGLKADAYPQGVEFHRDPDKLASSDQKQIALLINRVNDVLNQSDYKRQLALSDIERIKAIGKASGTQNQLSIPGISQPVPDTSGAVVAQTGAASLFQRELVSAPRTLTPLDLQPAGNVAVNLARALQHPGSEDDILMADGDSINVPETPTTVQVIGAVMRSTGVLYRKDSGLQYYIDAAGGYAPDAAKPERVLVIHLGGGLAPVKTVKSIQPGDVIVVPPRVIAEKLSSGRTSDIDAIFRGITSTGLVVLVAKKLLGL